MDTFVTVYSTDSLAEANIITGHLESEGIECLLLNELTSQMKYGYSSMIGIQIQVLQSQLSQTIEILKETGYIKDEDDKPSPFIERLDAFTARIPIINKLVFGIRISILVAILVTFILLIIFYISFNTKPLIHELHINSSLYEQIVKSHWCIEDVSYLGKSYALGPDKDSNKLVMTIGDKVLCDKTIQFRENGRLFLPGFNPREREIRGHWRLDKNELQIYDTDTFQFVYDGLFTIDISENNLVLKSPNTSIHCLKERINIDLSGHR